MCKMLTANRTHLKRNQKIKKRIYSCELFLKGTPLLSNFF